MIPEVSHATLPQLLIDDLTLDEKIGQLFIAPAYPLDENAATEGQPVNNRDYIQRLVKDYHVGGVLLKYYWDVEDQKKTVETLQGFSKIPLFVAQDCEWGAAMRMREVIPLPKNMALGAMRNLETLELVGQEIGRQCRATGVNFALAPVADVNSNPLNPIIGIRSFGDNPYEVGKRVKAVVKGIQNCGVLACVKHFPGHGDTHIDSHYALPLLEHMELGPFLKAIRSGVQAIMTGHLVVKDVDDLPASYSKKIVQKLLREEIGFQGLVITDDVLMKAVRDVDNLAERIFQSGSDLILSASDIPASIEAIKRAVREGVITEEEIDIRVARILFAKLWMTEWIEDEEINPKVEDLNTRLYREIVTVANTPMALCYRYRVIASCGMELISLIEHDKSGQKLVILKGADDSAAKKIDENTIVILLGSPYELAKLPKVPTIVGYDDSVYAQRAIAEVLNGELTPTGRLPIQD